MIVKQLIQKRIRKLLKERSGLLAHLTRSEKPQVNCLYDRTKNELRRTKINELTAMIRCLQIFYHRHYAGQNDPPHA